MAMDQELYRLTISPPKVEDSGKYTCEIGGITTTCYLTVEGNLKHLILISVSCSQLN